MGTCDLDIADRGEERERLRHEVIRLQDLLLQHGIEPGIQPGHGSQQTAQAGLGMLSRSLA